MLKQQTLFRQHVFAKLYQRNSIHLVKNVVIFICSKWFFSSINKWMHFWRKCFSVDTAIPFDVKCFFLLLRRPRAVMRKEGKQNLEYWSTFEYEWIYISASFLFNNCMISFSMSIGEFFGPYLLNAFSSWSIKNFVKFHHISVASF